MPAKSTQGRSVQFSITLPPKVLEQLQRIAAKECRAVGYIIRRACERELSACVNGSEGSSD